MMPLILVALAALPMGSAIANDEDDSVVLRAESTWRIWRGYDSVQVRQADGSLNDPRGRRADIIVPSPAPDAPWMESDYDDQHWPQVVGPLYLGHNGDGFGYRLTRNLQSVLMRGYFSIDDASKVNALNLDVTFRGGVRVFVNGTEVGRAYVAAGDEALDIPAADYPATAWHGAEGQAIGPINEWSDPQQFRENIEQRIRRLGRVDIPSRVLRDGVNVLAIELRRTAVPHNLPRYAGGRDGWSTLGLLDVSLRADGAVGVHGPHQGPAQPWNADPLDRISPVSAPANPWASLQPLRLVLPRGGRASGQVVIPPGATISALSLGTLVAEHGGNIPASAVQLRHAVRKLAHLDNETEFFDALLPGPNESSDPSQPQPLWLTVDLDSEIAAGSYTGQLELEINGRQHAVPLQVDVAGWSLPPSQQWRSWGSFWHSPFNVARHYGVNAWTDQHRQLLAPALKLLGTAGNDVLVVSAIRGTLHGNAHSILEFRQENGQLRPDFTGIDAYLSDYQQHVGPPRVLALYAWEHSSRGRNRLPVVIRDPDGKTQEANAALDAAIWQPVISGLRQRMDRLGWQDVEIAIGVGHDARPTTAEVTFWNEQLPNARWLVFSHWRGDPPPRDGARVLAGGLAVAVGETPFLHRGFGPDSSPFQGGGDSADGNYVMLTSLRQQVEDHAPPEQYRAAGDISVSGEQHGEQHDGFTRMGFDYWPHGNDGQLWNWRGWNNLYRDNARWIIAPGPDGPVSTVRYEMLVEGRHETEARIVIEQALRDPERRSQLSPELVAEAEDLLRQRLIWRFAGDTWHPGPNWQARTLQLYQLAAAMP